MCCTTAKDKPCEASSVSTCGRGSLCLGSSILSQPAVLSLEVTQPVATAQPYINGTAQAQQIAIGTTNPTAPFYIGILNNSGASSNPFAGTVYLASLAVPMPAADRRAIEAFAASLNGATWF